MKTPCLCLLLVFLMTAVSSGVEIEGVTDFTGMLQRQLESRDRPEPKESSGRIFWMYQALLIDFIWISLKMVAAWADKSIGVGCEFLFTLLWYPLTIHTLGWAFPGTTVSQGVDLATQQITSIGYGSANVRGNDQKLFHAVNGLASQLGPANMAGFLLGKWTDFVYAFMPHERAAAAAAAEAKVKEKYVEWAPEFLERYCPDAVFQTLPGGEKMFNGNEDECKESANQLEFVKMEKILAAGPPEIHVFNATKYYSTVRAYLDEQVETLEAKKKWDLATGVKDYITAKVTEENDSFWKKIITGTVLATFGALAYALLSNNGDNVGGLQAVYAVLISATTIGYGDFSPNKDWEKQLSAFVLPFLTASFAEFFGGAFASRDKDDLFKWLSDTLGVHILDEDCGFPVDALADYFIKKVQFAIDDACAKDPTAGCEGILQGIKAMFKRPMNKDPEKNKDKSTNFFDKKDHSKDIKMTDADDSEDIEDSEDFVENVQEIQKRTEWKQNQIYGNDKYKRSFPENRYKRSTPENKPSSNEKVPTEKVPEPDVPANKPSNTDKVPEPEITDGPQTGKTSETKSEGLFKDLPAEPEKKSAYVPSSRSRLGQ